MRYLLSLLTLPRPFQAAVKEGKIGLTLGYLFAENLDNPKLYEIFDAILKKPVTYDELKKLLDQAAGKGKQTTPKVPFAGFYSNIKTVRTAFEKGKAAFNQQDMEKLVTELEAFCALVKEQAQKLAAEAAAHAVTASKSGKTQRLRGNQGHAGGAQSQSRSDTKSITKEENDKEKSTSMMNAGFMATATVARMFDFKASMASIISLC